MGQEDFWRIPDQNSGEILEEITVGNPGEDSGGIDENLFDELF